MTPNSAPVHPREFFWLFVRRDMSMRYAGSTLGALWNLIHPLVMIGIYMIIFSSLMPNRGGSAVGRVDYGTLGYGVHLCAGLIPWLLFSDVLTRSLGVLIENGNFLKKVSFPPVVLFTAVLFNGLIIYGIGYLVFLVLLALLGPIPPLSSLAVLGVMLLLGLSAMGLGLVLSGMNVFLRDTSQVVTVAMQVLFWLNPIVYDKAAIHAFNPAVPASQLPWLERLGRGLVFINPFDRFITASQWLVGQAPQAPGPWGWAIVALFPAACIALGYAAFRRMLPEVRDTL